MLNLAKIDQAVRHEGGVSRRLFLSYAAALAAVPLLADRAAAVGPTTRAAAASFAADPFALGVASGDPDPTSVALWTRLAPRPLEADGGMSPTAVNVKWEVAEDEAMRKVVRRGTATAAPELAHSVHVEVEGLQPDRWYWYRFRAGDADSPVGRTRTMPVASATPQRLRFAFASCQHYESGLYTAYQRMVEDELDLIVHLGDYIYEGAPGKSNVRQHHSPLCTTLETYRMRHAQYRSDPLLQAAHVKCPWLVTWDDHEVFNNYANDHSETKGVSPAEVLKRRAAAYQAYYEAMPLRRRSLPRGPDMDLYRSCRFGRLAAFQVLDTRQYRTPQPGTGLVPLEGAAMSERATILGDAQKRWLRDGLSKSTATWNVLAQQVMMAMVDGVAGEEKGYGTDRWTGYAHDRLELMKFIAERKVANPVVLTGDIHSNWVNELRIDDRETDKPIVATEFVGTSISSSGNGVDKPANLDRLMAENACLRFHNRQRGYVRCEVTPQAWRSDFVTVSDVTTPDAPTNVRASYVVEVGRPGVQQA
jgi:alkaline phosphatase D